MGLVKALQGAPDSFKGYTDVMEKKTQRDFLSGQADLANTRMMAMKKLENERATTLQNDRLAAQKESQQAGFTHSEQMEGTRLANNMAVTNQNFTNSKKLAELSVEAADTARKKNVELFDSETADTLREGGMPESEIAIMRNTAGLGKEIGTYASALATAKAKGKTGGLSMKDLITIKKDAFSAYGDLDSDSKKTYEQQGMAKYKVKGMGHLIFRDEYTVNALGINSGGGSEPTTIKPIKNLPGLVDKALLVGNNLKDVLLGVPDSQKEEFKKLYVAKVKEREGGLTTVPNAPGSTKISGNGSIADSMKSALSGFFTAEDEDSPESTLQQRMIDNANKR